MHQTHSKSGTTKKITTKILTDEERVFNFIQQVKKDKTKLNEIFVSVGIRKPKSATKK